MSFKTFLRHVREGFKNVFRNGWMSVASITSIVVSLLVLGVFILLVLNVNSLADKADSQVQITVHLTLETKEALRDTIQNEIGSMPEVSKVEFVSKEQGSLSCARIWGRMPTASWRDLTRTTIR